jgi:YggT family protein
VKRSTLCWDSANARTRRRLSSAAAAALEIALMLLASARTDIAEFLSTVIYIYTLLIIIYIVTNLLFAAGLRPPYSRWSNAVLAFLRDVCEPFLRIFRRILPSFGGFDFSPIIAIIVLGIVNRVLVEGVIHG